MTQISGLWRRLGYMQSSSSFMFAANLGIQSDTWPAVGETLWYTWNPQGQPFTQPVVEKLDDFQPENKWEMVGQITISIHFKLVVWGSRYFWLMNCMTISLCPTERPGSIWVLPGKDEFARSGWVFGSCEVVGSGDNWKPGKLLELLLIFNDGIVCSKNDPHNTVYIFIWSVFLADWLVGKCKIFIWCRSSSPMVHGVPYQLMWSIWTNRQTWCWNTGFQFKSYQICNRIAWTISNINRTSLRD